MKKVALITGSKGGIGSAISSQLVQDGYRVVATYFTGNYQCALDWFNEKGFTEEQVRLFELDVTNTQECAERLSQLLDTESEVSHNSWPRATSWGPIGDQIAIYGQILTSQDDFHHRSGWEKWEWWETGSAFTFFLLSNDKQEWFSTL